MRGAPPPSVLDRARAALSRRAWEEARGLFVEAAASDPSPEAYEGLGLASWNLDDEPATFDARERAYRLYRQRDDRAGAARMATWLAWDHAAFRGERAVAQGWIARAHRLVDGLPPTPEHAWLALREGSMALTQEGDTERALACAARAIAVGRELPSPDLELIGLALEGLAMVTEGAVEEGMRRLDETAAAAASGEIGDLVGAGLATCWLIFGCEQVRDYDRAGEWCLRLQEVCERHGIRALFAVCRTHYADVLMWHGSWQEAESELRAASGQLSDLRPGQASEGVARLGELRRRQGLLDEAVALFRQAHPHPVAILGLAEAALDAGNAPEAVDLARRYLRRLPERSRTERSGGLEILVRAAVAAGIADQAERAASELDAIAAAVGTPPLRAAASFSAGVVAAAGRDLEAGRRHLEDAVDLYASCGAPFEEARARLALAGVLRSLGRDDGAVEEAGRALEGWERIGAAGEAARARSLMGLRTPHRPESGPLTGRELEVLKLLADGLSNHDIAGRLVLSEHTVHRHVANILAKLGVGTRAAAVGLAGRLGLV